MCVAMVLLFVLAEMDEGSWQPGPALGGGRLGMRLGPPPPRGPPILFVY
ncbi:putative extensin [Iris pallida]|uniref:Extensin n=1 Tax=Iris pallida TaxID=29817 RepID=A0AAX6G386_IRIPA|nr:putative extensin [Iris pallida]